MFNGPVNRRMFVDTGRVVGVVRSMFLCVMVVMISSAAHAAGGRTPGDLNGDGNLDTGDLTLLVQYVSFGTVPPFPMHADVDDDCCVTLADITYLQEHLFNGGPRPICGCATPLLLHPGDVNCDGAIDNADLVLLTGIIAGTATPCVPAHADVTGDCCVDSDDLAYLQAFLFGGGPAPVDCTCHNPRMNFPGDVNCDGLIDASDITALAGMLSSGIPHPGCSPENADANGDSCVTQTDLTLISDFLFAGGPAPVGCAPVNPVFPVVHFPGDANSNGLIESADIVFLVSYLNGGGPAPSPLANGDANGDCCLNLDDTDYISEFLFSGGPHPPECTCTRPLTVCGDADGNGIVSIGDVTCLIAEIFSCTTLSCMADADGNQRVTIGDVTYLIKYIFSGGPAPIC